MLGWKPDTGCGSCLLHILASYWNSWKFRLLAQTAGNNGMLASQSCCRIRDWEALALLASGMVRVWWGTVLSTVGCWAAILACDPRDTSSPLLTQLCQPRTASTYGPMPSQAYSPRGPRQAGFIKAAVPFCSVETLFPSCHKADQSFSWFSSSKGLKNFEALMSSLFHLYNLGMFI